MLFGYLRGEISTGAMLASIIGAAVAITVHEYAHARRALAAGLKTSFALRSSAKRENSACTLTNQHGAG